MTIKIWNKGEGAGPAEGTQSIGRALGLLRLIAERNEAGASLTELAELSGLSKPTAHRILQTLAHERFVERHAGTRRYLLGLEFFSLSSLTSNRLNLQELARPVLVQLADRTGDTIFLSVRSGLDAICLARVEGSFPIKALTLAVGGRRPLGVGAGSLALLAACSEETVHEILVRKAAELTAYPGFDIETLARLARQTRAQGYAFNDGRIVRGMSGVGVAVLDASREPAAALSIAAISERMRKDRRPVIVGLLRQAARDLQNAVVRNLGVNRPVESAR